MFKKTTALTLLALAATVPAFAEEGAAVASAATNLKPFGAALALGIAALGGTLAQAKAASAALDGIARNPAAADKLFTPMIIALALIESLVLFSFLINVI